MPRRPTLIFVHGAWHSPDAWDKVAPLMDGRQFKCVRIALPSTKPGPPCSFADDVEMVRNAILAETRQSNDVVLVVHSYGGAVGSTALKGLTLSKELPTGSVQTTAGHVIGLVMLVSFFITTGLFFTGHLGNRPSPWWTPNPENGRAELTLDPSPLFYNDLPPEEGEFWARKLNSQSTAGLMEGGEHAYAGWMDVPAWYLACNNDKAVPVETQRMFVQRAKDAGADVTAREMDSSHSPMLSKPKETAEFITEAVAAFLKD